MGRKYNINMRPWYQNNGIFLLICLLLPPAGLVVLWFRRDFRVIRKISFSIGLLTLTFFHLFTFYGLRVEMAGSGAAPIFTFHNPDSHFDEIEQRQRVEPGTVEAASRPSIEGGAYWTDFRGPNRDGHYQEHPINTTWEDGRLPELWRQSVGGGYASVVVAEGRVFTIEQRRDHETVACYDLGSGKEFWTHAWKSLFQESLGGDGPRATPTWHEGRVYALGAGGDLRVLDAAAGRLIWEKNILSDNGASNLTWAMSASPLIVDEKVLVQPGGPGGHSLVAYHKDTGEPIWKSLDDKQAYTSPMLVTLAGRRQLLAVSAERLMGLSVDDGALLWDYPWTTSYDANIPQPLLVDENTVFVSAGYGHGSALVRVSEDNGAFAAAEVWKNNRMKAKFNPPVLHEGHVYGLDESILQCIDVQTGEQKWKGGRYGYGQVLLADGHLIIVTEQGDLVLVKATPESHQELARFSAISGKTWNNPAIADGRLIVRNQTEMACYDISGT